MTEPIVAELPVTTLGGLQLLGEPAAACEGDFCEIPPHHEQHVINNRIDSDRV